MNNISNKFGKSFNQGKEGNIVDPSEEISSIKNPEKMKPGGLINAVKKMKTPAITIEEIKNYINGWENYDIQLTIEIYQEEEKTRVQKEYGDDYEALSDDKKEIKKQEGIFFSKRVGELNEYLEQKKEAPNFEKSNKELSTISNSMAKMGEVIKNIPFIKNLFSKQVKPDESLSLVNSEPEGETQEPQSPLTTQRQEVSINLMKNREQGVQTLENMSPAQKRETFAKIKSWFENADPRKINWKAVGDAAIENKVLLIATGVAAGTTMYVSAPVILSALGAMGLAGGIVNGTYIAGTGVAASAFGSGSIGTFGSMGLAGAGGSAGTIATGLSALSGGITTVLGKMSKNRLFQKPEKYEAGQNQTKKSISKLQKKIVEHTLANTAGKKLDKQKLEKFVDESISTLYAYLIQSGQIFPGDDIPELFEIEGQKWRKNIYFYELHENDKNFKYFEEGSSTPNPVTPIIPINIPDQPNVSASNGVPNPSTPQQAPDPSGIVNPDPEQAPNQQPSVPLTPDQIETENTALFSNRIAKELEELISNKSVSDNNLFIQQETQQAIEHLKANIDAIRFINDGVDANSIRDKSKDTLIVSIIADEVEKCRKIGIKLGVDSKGQYKISVIDYGMLKAHQIAEKISKPQETEAKRVEIIKNQALELISSIKFQLSAAHPGTTLNEVVFMQVGYMLQGMQNGFIIGGGEGNNLLDEIQNELPKGFDFSLIGDNTVRMKWGKDGINTFSEASIKVLEKYSGTKIMEEMSDLGNNIDQEDEANRVNYLKNEANNLLLVVANLGNQETFEHMKASRSGIIQNFEDEGITGPNLFDEIATDLPESFKIRDVDRSKMEPWAITAMVESYRKTLQKLAGKTTMPVVLNVSETNEPDNNLNTIEARRTQYLQDFSIKLLKSINSDYDSHDLILNEVVFRSFGIKMNDFINDYDNKVGKGENIYNLIQDKVKNSFSINGIGEKKVRDSWMQNHPERVEEFSRAALEVLSELSGQLIPVEKDPNIPESSVNSSENIDPVGSEETKRLGFIKRESQKLSEIIFQESRSVPKSEYSELVFDIFCANMQSMIKNYNDQEITGGGLLEEIGTESGYTALGLVRLTMPENRRSWKSTIGYGQLSDSIIKVLEKYKDLDIHNENDINIAPEVTNYEAEKSAEETTIPTNTSPEVDNLKQVSNLVVKEKTAEASEAEKKPDLQSDAQKLLGLFANFNNQQLCNGLFDLRDHINAAKKANGISGQDIVEEIINQLPKHIVETYNKRNAIAGKSITPPFYNTTAPMIKEILNKFASGDFETITQNIKVVERVDIAEKREFNVQSYTDAASKLIQEVFTDPKKKEAIAKEVYDFTKANWGYGKNIFKNQMGLNVPRKSIELTILESNTANSLKNITNFENTLTQILRFVSYTMDGSISRSYSYNSFTYLCLSRMDKSVSNDLIKFCKDYPNEGDGHNSNDLANYINNLKSTGKLDQYQKAFEDALATF
ncbi:MAG: hypothetical protein H7196_00590 [candidate division SR1 bacterium]|nr:hypothetical protein [candidate division SR1 bacterium]